ncbi:MAG: ATP-binding cassette domain-containing protein [Candidatus Marinimicrobia bacterium]|nr:ATP-binding cassette domain-containing protein [Candidatus Neomarinimicrobiota bacterium]
MADQKRLIFEIQNLKKTIKNQQVINIGKLAFHPGTIYGVVGSTGSGKTKLMELLAGELAETSGTLNFDGEPYQKNWRGKVKPHPEIFYSHSPAYLNVNKTASQIVKSIYKKKENIIFKRYFSSAQTKKLWERTLDVYSPGEMDWFSLVLAIESDPRVLLIDDYAIRMEKVQEQDFRSQLIRMNRNLGTTIILASSSDRYLSQFASVLVHIDNGHISKIRPGVRTNYKKKPRSNNRPKQRSNQRPQKQARRRPKKRD